MDNDFENNANDGASEPRPVRAPGFANGSANGGNAADVVAPVNGGNDVVFQDRPKKSHGMLYSMILLAILAAGGIGFGVWAMLDGNSRAQKKDEQISQLQSQLAEKSEVVVDDDATVVDVETGDGENGFKNPIIKSNDSAEIYRLYFDSSVIGSSEGANVIRIDIKDGLVEKCEFGRRTYETGTGGQSTAPIAECNVIGLDGEIFKVVQFGAGQDSGLDRLGFIMADGSVKYTLPIHEAVSSNDLSIKGNLAVEGKVNDAVDVSVADAERGYGGYGATVFVLSDGSYVKYNDSMTQ